MKLEGKTIVVTGGSGFIGSNLCEYFSEHNQVICIDNLSTGRESNIEALKSSSNFTFLKGDITDLDFCLNAIPKNAYVLHNAALGSVSRSIESPVNTNLHNITGFLNVLEAVRIKEAKRMIYASSSSTYGDHPNLPKEEAIIGKPLSPYAVTKLANELYASVFNQIYKTEIIGLRYFNVFGKNQDPQGPYAAVIPRFITALMNGGKIEIYGDGEQTRDFTHITNVIHAIECAALTESKEAFGEVFNVAYGNRFSLNELLDVMKSLLLEHNALVEPIIEYKDARLGDIRDSFASIKKAEDLLNYSPKTSLKEGIERMIKEGY